MIEVIKEWISNLFRPNAPEEIELNFVIDEPEFEEGDRFEKDGTIYYVLFVIAERDGYYYALVNEDTDEINTYLINKTEKE